jgi:hypothetical protein
VWTTTGAAAVFFGGALVTAARGVVTTGEGAADLLGAGVCDGEAVAPTVGPRAVVVGGGAVEPINAKSATTPTTAVMMPRRRTDQSGRSQSRTRPTGKKKIRKSTTETVRRYQGCVSCINCVDWVDPSAAPRHGTAR